MLSNWTNKLASLVLFTVLARLLEPRELGLFAAAMVVFNLLALFADQGLGEAIIQRREVTPEQLNTIFGLNFLIAAVLYLVLWFTAPAISERLHLPDLPPLLRVGGVTVLLGATCFTQRAMLRRNFDYRWLAVSVVAATLISGAVAILCALRGFGTWALVVQSVLGALVIAVVLWCRPQWRPTTAISFDGVPAMFGYGVNRLGVSLLDFAYSRSIELFIASSLGPVALGTYTVGVRVYYAFQQLLSSSVLDVAQSGFSRISDDRERLVASYYGAVKISVALAFPLFVWLCTFAPELSLHLFGAKWADSASIISAMGWLGAVQVVSAYNGTLLNVVGRPSLVLLLVVLKAIVTLTALWLNHSTDLMTIVYGFVAAQLLVVPISFAFLSRVVRVSLVRVAQQIWPFILASVLAFCGIRALQHNWPFLQGTIVALAVLSVVWGLLYLLILRALGQFTFRIGLDLVRTRLKQRYGS